jgi:hypothetical protein
VTKTYLEGILRQWHTAENYTYKMCIFVAIYDGIYEISAQR